MKQPSAIFYDVRHLARAAAAKLSCAAPGFAARHQLPLTNLMAEPDPDVLTIFSGGAFVGTPTHYFYDPLGRIVARKISPLPKEDIEAFIEAFEKSPYARH